MSTHPATLPLEELLRDCRVTFSRAGGPGGQHRNKVSTAVDWVHLPTQVSGSATESRSQAENRQVALQRLRIHLALAVRTPWPADRRPLPVWEKFRRGHRLTIRADHADFPAILSELLDCCSDAHGDLALVAERVGLSATQVLKLLLVEGAAWQWWANLRQQWGLPPLRPPR